MDQQSHRGLRRGWWRRVAETDAGRDAAAVLWVVALACTFLMPALRYGTALGPFDLGNNLSGLGHGLYPGVHNGWLGDQIEELLPWNAFDWRQIHHLRFPLWNPDSLLGLPQFFNFQSAALSLPDLVGYAFPLHLSFLAAAVAKLALAGTGAYLFGRVAGWGRAGAVFAAVAYELSGPFASEIGWPLADVFAWLGWIFAFTWLICRDGGGRAAARGTRGGTVHECIGGRNGGAAPRGGEVPRSGTARRDVGLLAVCVAFAVYGGFPEADVLLAGAWAVFAAALLLGSPRGGRGVAAARLAAAWVAGLGLAAPLWLPGAQLMLGSARLAVRHHPTIPLRTLPDLLLQGYDGYPTSSSVWFGPLTYYETVAYVGVVAAVLAAVGAVSGRLRRGRPRPRGADASGAGGIEEAVGAGGAEEAGGGARGADEAVGAGDEDGVPLPAAAVPRPARAGRQATRLSARALSATALAMAAVAYGPDPFTLLGTVLPGAGAVVAGRARVPLAFALCCLAGIGLRELIDACAGHPAEDRAPAAASTALGSTGEGPTAAGATGSTTGGGTMAVAWAGQASGSASPPALRACVAASAAVAVLLAGLLLRTLLRPGGLTPVEVAIRLRSFIWAAVGQGTLGAAAWLVAAEHGRPPTEHGQPAADHGRPAAEHGRPAGSRLPPRRGAMAAGLLLAVETAFLLTSGVALNTYSHRFFPETRSARALGQVVAPVSAAAGGRPLRTAAVVRHLPTGKGRWPALNGGPVGFAAAAAPAAGGGAAGSGWSSYRGLGLVPEMNLAYGIPEMAAYDPMLPAAYPDAWSAETGAPPEPGGWFVPTFASAAEARTWGVPYVLGPGDGPMPPGMVPVASLGGEELYRVPGAHRFTLVALAGAGAPADGASGKGPAEEARGRILHIRRAGAARWMLRVATARPARLLVRLTEVPGWHATVDGRPVPLRPWHQVMQQVDLPPGVHVVRLWYWPRLFTLGLALCAAAAGVLVTAGLWPRRWGPGATDRVTGDGSA